eukprot:TRINITY_DN7948_c0_g1_i4.p1 TRINITY_DN7948_c0_g1~~TRINITY_DN7948_c0_g1_i4.p1  ORF type:complete len:1079 (+),score=202.75 TRINITY_DN7948_c0_g1_i4:51-3287(+)
MEEKEIFSGSNRGSVSVQPRNLDSSSGGLVNVVAAMTKAELQHMERIVERLLKTELQKLEAVIQASEARVIEAVGRHVSALQLRTGAFATSEASDNSKAPSGNWRSERSSVGNGRASVTIPKRHRKMSLADMDDMQTARILQAEGLDEAAPSRKTSGNIDTSSPRSRRGSKKEGSRAAPPSEEPRRPQGPAEQPPLLTPVLPGVMARGSLSSPTAQKNRASGGRMRSKEEGTARSAASPWTSEKADKPAQGSAKKSVASRWGLPTFRGSKVAEASPVSERRASVESIDPWALSLERRVSTELSFTAVQSLKSAPTPPPPAVEVGRPPVVEAQATGRKFAPMMQRVRLKLNAVRSLQPAAVQDRVDPSAEPKQASAARGSVQSLAVPEVPQRAASPAGSRSPSICSKNGSRGCSRNCSRSCSRNGSRSSSSGSRSCSRSLRSAHSESEIDNRNALERDEEVVDVFSARPSHKTVFNNCRNFETKESFDSDHDDTHGEEPHATTVASTFASASAAVAPTSGALGSMDARPSSPPPGAFNAEALAQALAHALEEQPEQAQTRELAPALRHSLSSNYTVQSLVVPSSRPSNNCSVRNSLASPRLSNASSLRGPSRPLTPRRSFSLHAPPYSGAPAEASDTLSNGSDSSVEAKNVCGNLRPMSRRASRWGGSVEQISRRNSICSSAKTTSANTSLKELKRYQENALVDEASSSEYIIMEMPSINETTMSGRLWWLPMNVLRLLGMAADHGSMGTVALTFTLLLCVYSFCSTVLLSVKGVYSLYSGASVAIMAASNIFGVASLRWSGISRVLGPIASPLERHALKHGFLHFWTSKSLRKLCIATFAWLSAIAFAVIREILVTVGVGNTSCDGVLDVGIFSLTTLWRVATFAHVSGMFIGLIYAQKHVLSCLELMVDSFCLRVMSCDDGEDLSWFVSEWNVLAAILRQIARTIEHCFLSLQTSALIALLLSAVGFWQNTQLLCNLHLLEMSLEHIPTLILALAALLLFFQATVVTEKCGRVPLLVNAIPLSNHMDVKRQYVVFYIMNSAAGFYVRDVRLTAFMALKITYAFGAAVFGLLIKVAVD